MKAPDSRLNFSRSYAGKLGSVIGRSPATLVLAALFALAGNTARAQTTLNIINNFSATNGGTYFGGNIENQDISLYFTGSNVGDITYNGGTAVTPGSQIQLSSVTGGSFTFSSAVAGARVYAILGSSAPSSISASGPDASSGTTQPYSFIELTTKSSGKADQSFLNQVSFPTSLSNGTQTNAWAPTATAQTIATAFNTAFPSAPFAPASGTAAGSSAPYDPYMPTTVTRSAGAVQTPISGNRVVAASNVNLPAASDAPQFGTGYTNVPGFNDYLGYLQLHAPTGGWQFGFSSAGSPDSTYVGFLTVTGSNGNYGIQLSNFTYGGVLASGTMTGGITVTGTITYAANNSSQSVFGVPYTGNWTDMTIFTAGNPASSVVTTSGDLGALDQASVLYTVSASLGPGILGSVAYVNSGSDTDSFFKTGLTAGNALTNFFANSTFTGTSQTDFYDQYWYTMLQAGGVNSGTYAGYFTPYDDHFDGLNVLMPSDSGTLTWQLGTALDGSVPEPGTIALLTLASAALSIHLIRRNRQKSAA